jgi:hypothetical protein
MKPQLPIEISAKLPDDIVSYIQTFVPHLPKPKKPRTPSVSPNMERDLRLIQNMQLRGKDNMFLRDLEDFLLD